MRHEERCYNGGRKHKFVPRYDEVPNNIKFSAIEGVYPEELRKLLYYNIYLFDICEWCGKKIKKEDRK